MMVVLLGMIFPIESMYGQCSTPSTRSTPTIVLGSGYTSSGSNPAYLGPGYSTTITVNSNTYFVIENVTSGRNIRISTCGASYDSQITLRDWSTDTYLGYVDDNGPACTGTRSSIDYSGNSSYPHVKVIINQYNCGTASISTPVTITFTSEATAPANPTSISASSSTICNGNSTTLTANGAVGTVYWYTGGCGSTQIGTGSSISVSPSTSTTYYARNYNNSQFSSGCASATITVNSAPTVTTTNSFSSLNSTTAVANGDISSLGGVNLTQYGHCWSTSSGPTTSNSKTELGSKSATGSYTSSMTGLTANTLYYVRAYATNSCGTSYGAEYTVRTLPADVTSISASSSTICNGQSTTLTANGVVGTVYWYTGGCGSTQIGTGSSISVSPTTSTTYYAKNYSNSQYSANCASTSITVNSLPTVAAITGANSVCPGNSTSLSCVTAGGTWSSSNSSVASINSSGLVTGVSAGTVTISYLVTNANNCSSSSTYSVTVLPIATTPTSVTATPSTIQTGQSSNLNATSAGNSIKWFTEVSGGSSVGISASGTNFSVSPEATTTYYAESYSPASFYISTLTPNSYAVVDHNNYTGDDRGGIAITPSYVYYSGDSYTVRYDMSTLANPLKCTRRDGLFSDLSTGTVYTLWNGSSDPVYSTNTSSYTVTHLRSLTTDLSFGDTYVALSSPVTMTQSNSAIYAGYGFVVLQNGTNFYRIDIPSGSVTSYSPGTSISRYPTENWATWGVAEKNGSVYSVLYRESGTQNIQRLNLSTGSVATLTTFSNLSDLSCFTYSPWNNRWYYHYEGSGQFGGSAETLGYASATHTVSAESCPSSTRVPVTVTIANPPSVSTGSSVTSITNTTASITSNVTLQGGSTVTARGVCYATTQNPTVSNSKTTNGSGTGQFVSNLSGLTAGTVYYVRAYATNTQGTSYGEQISFTTYSAGQIGSNQTICSGSTPATLTSSVAAIGMPSVTYQWQQSANNVTFENITGATATTYQPIALYQVMYFRRNATSGSVTLSSNTVTVSISSGAALPTAATATPSAILSGQSASITATVTAGNEVKWYDAALGGNLLATKSSATNYVVAPTTTTTYYAQTSPVQTSNNTLANILTALNTNQANIAAQIPSKYDIRNEGYSNYIGDGGNDMYDNGNYLSTPNSTKFAYSDNTILSNSVFGSNSKYFTRFVNGMFFLAADLNSTSYFKVHGNYGSDGGGSNDYGTFTVTINGMSFNCYVSRIYNATDPSINELMIIPSNPSASYRPIGNTADNYSQLSDLTASTRLYYMLYAGSNGLYINNTQAQAIATAFLSQIGAVVLGSNDCPSATRVPVTVTVSSVPSVTTVSTSGVTATGAIVNANVTSEGGQTVTARGVCWSTSQNPTISNNKTVESSGTGEFTSSIAGLSAGTTYYVRAYATNSMGTGYGEQISIQPFTLGTFANMSKTYGDDPFTLVNPTSLSTGVFTYASSNTNVATVSGNTVTVVGAGTTIITCTQAASGVYASATKIATLTVAKKNQIISLSVPTSAPLNTFFDTSIEVSATSSSGLSVTVSKGSSSTASGLISLNEGSYYLSGVGSTGTIVVEATQEGNDNYNSATISQSFDVTKGNQAITFGALSDKAYGDAPFVLSATGGASANPVVFTSSNINVAVCSGDNGTTVTIVGAGTVSIIANQAGNNNWNAANEVSQLLTVNKATPVITNFDDVNKSFDDQSFTLQASSLSTGAFSYSSDNSAVATVTGNVVTINGVGTATLTATQAMDNNYSGSTATATLTVSKSNQTISFDALSDVLLVDFEGNPVELNATSSVGLPISFSISGHATLSGSSIESTGTTGLVSVTASQSGSDNYNAAESVIRTFNVNKAPQTITFDALPDVLIGAEDFDLTATSSSNLAVTYTSSNTGVATIDGKTVTVIGVGTTTITASQIGNDYYEAAANVQRTLTVNKGNQTITFEPLASKVVGEAAFTVSATGGNSGNHVVFTSSNTNVATCSGSNGSTVTIIGAGTCTIYANQVGSSLYNAASQVGQTLIVSAKSIAVSSNTATLAKEVGSLSSVTLTSNTAWTVTSSEDWLVVSPTSGSGNGTLALTADAANETASARTATVTISSDGITSVTITVTQMGIPASDYYYRTTSNSSWSNAGQWEYSLDGVNWQSYPGEPDVSAVSFTVQNTVDLPDSKTLNSPTITVTPSGRFNVHGTIENDTKLIIESNDTGTGQVLNGGTITNTTGVIVFRKTFLKASGWYFISFPYDVPAANVKIGGTNTQATWGDITDTGVDFYVQEYDGARRDATGTAVNTNSPNWKNVSPKIFEKDKGYIIAVTANKTLDFVSSVGENQPFGTSGSKSVSKYTTNSINVHNSWNLVGEPFLSSFDLQNATQEHAPFYYYDGSTYQTVMTGDSYSMLPFGAFFLQAHGEEDVISYAAAGRNLRKVVAENSFEEIPLVLSNGTYTDKTRVRLQAGSSTDYELGKDAIKMMSLNATVPQIYTVNSTYGYSVNSLPLTTNVVDLVVTTGGAGSYTINLSDITSAPSYESILLVDGNNKTNLLEGSYSFTTNAASKKNMQLQLSLGVYTSLTSASDKNIQVETIDNQVYISGLEGLGDVQVYDLTGRPVQLFVDVENDQPLRIQNIGVSILHITTHTQKAYAKVLIK